MLAVDADGVPVIAATPSPVPEPAATATFGVGLLLVSWFVRRCRSA